ncbi:MAG: NAD(P)H-binding protein [Bacteroidetes bacterium]|nr:NAD(P)H-binding protein [Bacteroidota bacterium]MBT5530704.1 NAD(P)H-binding protein [Cytophagia bacterium]MBT7039798.1 NAD(P)H-binding protein [Bacteroidota bacterium]MBT7996350.1 NAD(P)H-binding protein [Bacteroidota bacterium]
MSSNTAIVFGSTGLVGTELLNLLIDDNYWTKAEVFLRQALPITSPKIIQHVTNFDQIDKYAHLIKGDVIFICLGTTIKTAGSQDAFRYVDYELPVKVATLAHENGVKRLVLISSLGANSNSSNFYLRTKGEVEEKIKTIGFSHYYFLRPSLLLGSRREKRFGEKLGKVFMQTFKIALRGKLRKYRGVQASDVAKAMNIVIQKGLNENIIESEKIIEMTQI